jgi:hypothetical protein
MGADGGTQISSDFNSIFVSHKPWRLFVSGRFAGIEERRFAEIGPGEILFIRCRWSGDTDDGGNSMQIDFTRICFARLAEIEERRLAQFVGH